MTDVLYDFLANAVDMIITATILSAVIVLLRSGTILSNYTAGQQATAERLHYYKEYNMYDCTEKLSCADALSAIMYYRYDIEVVIALSSDVYYYNDYSDGKLYKSSMGTLEEITYEDLKDELESDLKFDSVLYENLSDVPSSGGYRGGIITGIKLTKVETGGV